MLTTTRCARASSRPWRRSCCRGTASRAKPRRAWPASATLRAGTIRTGAIPRWGTYVVGGQPAIGRPLEVHRLVGGRARALTDPLLDQCKLVQRGVLAARSPEL